jgi:hypothetical protein
MCLFQDALGEEEEMDGEASDDSEYYEDQTEMTTGSE